MLFRSASTAKEFDQLARLSSAVPVAAREFSRSEALLVRWPVYGASSAPPDVRLLGRSGQAMRTLTAATFDGRALPSPGIWYQVSLALSSLAPGEYSLEVVVSPGAPREVLTFRVTS